AIVALHKCRAAFHPVTTVVICDVAELTDSGAMNVATEHGIYVIAFRIMRDSSFEFANEADGVFHPPLCIRAKRPVAQAEPSSDEIDERIQREQKLIANVTGECQPLHILHHRVQFVSMND